jgi:hypothetical protein
LKPRLRFRCAAVFYTQGVCAFASVEPTESVREVEGEYHSIVTVPAHFFSEGEHTAGISIFTSIGTKQHFVKMHDAVQFQVRDAIDGDSARGDYTQNLDGVVRPLLSWKSNYHGVAMDR